MKSNRGKMIRTRGEKTIIYRVKLPKVSENSLYTGFFAFGKKNCGEDFIEQLGNGKIMWVLSYYLQYWQVIIALTFWTKRPSTKLSASIRDKRQNITIQVRSENLNFVCIFDSFPIRQRPQGVRQLLWQQGRRSSRLDASLYRRGYI